MIHLTINGKPHSVDADPAMPLLWVIRDVIGLTGTKFGCGMGQCGVCTVHLDGEAVRSCLSPLAMASGKAITTIEGLKGDVAKRVQQAWLEVDVVQCGYCQPGQIMSAVALLHKHSNPDDQAINMAMSGNICRCGTYQRIRKAIHLAAALKDGQ